MVNDSSKTVGQTNNKIPRQSGDYEEHHQLGQDHPADNPFEIWVVTKELLDLRIFLCNKKAVTSCPFQCCQNIQNLPRISFLLEACGSSVVDHSKSVLDT